MSQLLRGIFDFELLRDAFRKRENLPTALRQLADMIERGEIDGSLWGVQGHGFQSRYDTRVHALLTLDLAAQVRRPVVVHDDLPASAAAQTETLPEEL